MSERHIKVDYLARCEGETGLDIYLEDGEVRDVKLEVFEPPRFFEGFLVGRRYDEVPGMVSRICGICPTSHQLSATLALERAMGVEVSRQTTDLRRLLALSQWIQSHALHLYVLAAPDYLGYESVVGMAGNPKLVPVVQRALRLKRLGNDLTAVIGGREVHPVTITIGGFTALPDRGRLAAIRKRLVEAKDDAQETMRMVSDLQLPVFHRVCEHVALHHPAHYAVNEGRLVSTEGLDVPHWEYPLHLVERHLPHSHAKHGVIAGRDSFLVGPLARVNNNWDQLSPYARTAGRECGVPFPNFNPFVSAVARGIELVHSIDESVAIIDRLDLKPESPSFEVKAGEGYAVTEAARGICCHGYLLDKNGLVEKADIVAPTAWNAYNIEKDLRVFVPRISTLPDEEITLKCEMLIRAYDPCFSCSVHSLRVKMHRS